ncbi:MAG: hypothetical protein Q8O30_00360 [Candidatus Omnitrophota bacterium]|nr:hypothetical protein [Candidatus Omnitrophota bacterium]
MNTNKRNFTIWFKNAIIVLQKRRAFGYPLLCISFPLLERYLREKSKNFQSGSLNENFHKEFLKLFPEALSLDDAKKIWKAYRNGILHQVAPSRVGPRGKQTAVSHDCSIIAYDKKNNLVVINPKKFSQRVIEIIEKDFSTYEGKNSPDHPLPKVRLINKK